MCPACLCLWHREGPHLHLCYALTVKSDHILLEHINPKNLEDTPVCLQRLLLWYRTIMSPSRINLAKICWLQIPYLTMHSEILLNITINQVYITPDKKSEFQAIILDDPLLHFLTKAIIVDGQKILMMSHVLYGHTMTSEMSLQLRMASSFMTKPSSFYPWKEEGEKIFNAIDEEHMGISKCQYCARHCVYWPGINADIRWIVESCPTYLYHCPQEPLQPTPALEHPWQHLSTDYFDIHGPECLVITNYCSRMPIVQRIPMSQCNASKNISVL